MALRGGWYIPGRVHLTEFHGDISDEEFIRGANHPEIIPALEASSAPLVHFIFDSERITKMPSLRVGSKTPLATHPKVGWVIVVRRIPNPVFKMMASIMGQMSKIRTRFVNSEAEAIEFLQYVDSTLPDFPTRDEVHWFNFVNWPQQDNPDK